ncbi:IS66 family transposase [Gynuella sunshinyii]|nr:transposase [Gynuella sunshinyii]
MIDSKAAALMNPVQQKNLMRQKCQPCTRRLSEDQLRLFDPESVQTDLPAAKNEPTIILVRWIKKFTAAREQSLNVEQHSQRRQDKAVPLLANCKIRQNSQTAPPKPVLGKTTQYSLNQCSRLVRYYENGLPDLNNNADERAIWPFAAGRMHWFFANTSRGGRTNVFFHHFIETCQLQGHEPYTYLKHLFKSCPNRPVRKTAKSYCSVIWM